MNTTLLLSTRILLLLLTSSWLLPQSQADDANEIAEESFDRRHHCVQITLTPEVRNFENFITGELDSDSGEINYHLIEDWETVSSSYSTDIECFDTNEEEECRYLFFRGNGYFAISSSDGLELSRSEGVVRYDQPALVRLGNNCRHYCGPNEQIVLVSEGLNKPTMHNKNNQQVVKKLLSQNNNEEEHESDVNFGMMCIEPTGCYTLVGNAVYLLTGNDTLVKEEGATYHGFKTFGSSSNCYPRCIDKPLLAATTRGREIASALSTISGMEALSDVQSPRYQAACWLIHDDFRQLDALEDDHDDILQRYVLALLYFTLGGQDWNRNFDFLAPTHECDWLKLHDTAAAPGSVGRCAVCDGHGVFCNEFGKVTGINLARNNLVGTIAPELSTLTNTEVLFLRSNLINGAIPPRLAGLTGLRVIDMSNNELSGSIPEALIQLTGLQDIYLWNNILSGNIVWNDLRHATTVFLQGNLLTGTIPREIGQWTSLRNLWLYDNALSGPIPEEFGNLEQLQYVDLDNNYLNGSIPSNMFASTRLEVLRLSYNSLSGTLPTQVSNASVLSILWLYSNSLTGPIPPQLTELQNLEILLLSYNLLTGPIPETITNLGNLNILWINHNDLTGIVSYEDCSQAPRHLEADCDTPEKVMCSCCTECYGVYTGYIDGPTCPAEDLTISLYTELEGSGLFSIDLYGLSFDGTESFIGDASFYAQNTFDERQGCISLLGCYRIDFYFLGAFGVMEVELFVNENEVLKETISVDVYDEIVNENVVTRTSARFPNLTFGYSSNHTTLRRNTCDAFTICNRTVDVNTKERELFNNLARIIGSRFLNDVSSPHYQAACHWLALLDREIEKNSGANSGCFQHYFVVLLFFATNGEKWLNSTLWLSTEPICAWYGIVCDDYGIVTAISLEGNNMHGSLPSEIGEIRGLEKIFLNDNELDGSIPEEIGFKLTRLTHFNVSNNRLTGLIPLEIGSLTGLLEFDVSHNLVSGSVPSEIGLMENLQVFNVQNNSLSDILPNSFSGLTNLITISLGNNLLAGNVSELDRLTRLESLDLSNNFFTGVIPLGAFQDRLKILRLHGNHFTGTVPSYIGNSTSLEELLLYSNQLSGRIPLEIGNIPNLTRISLSHNRLKGQIPSSIGNLRNLSLLHLHGNQLQGFGDYFNYTIAEYAADCGHTFTITARVDCNNCSICCNADGDCITADSTWPRRKTRQLELPPVVFVFLVTSGSCAGIVILFNFFYLLIDMITRVDSLSHTGEESWFNAMALQFVHSCRMSYARNFESCQEFQKESAYRFFLGNSALGICLGSLVVLIQVLLLVIFIQAADFSSVNNDWQYSLRCPDDSLRCNDTRYITKLGTAAFICILLCYLMKDFFEGMLMVYKSIIIGSKRGIIAGLVLMFITVCSCTASVLYNTSTGISNTDLLKDAVIILFLNQIDEQVYGLVKFLWPSWVFMQNRFISQYFDIKMTNSSRRRGSAMSTQFNMQNNRVSFGVADDTVENQNENNYEESESSLLEGGSQDTEVSSRSIHKLEENRKSTVLRDSDDLIVLENQLATVRNYCESLRRENDSSKIIDADRHQALMGQYQDLRDKYDTLTLDHTNLKKEHDHLRSDHDDLKQKFLEFLQDQNKAKLNE